MVAKKNTKSEERIDNNEISLSGEITFIKMNDKKTVTTCGIKSRYQGDNEKMFTTNSIVKWFGNDIGLKKGDVISAKGHFSTRTYKDKTGTDVFVQEIIVDELS